MIKEKTILINNREVHYLEAGKGENLVLLHGYLGSSDGFCYVVPVLSKTFHLIIPDLPGAGFRSKNNSYFSEELPGKNSVFSYLDFLCSFVNKLNLKKVNLLGLSMGGTLSLEYAKRNPSKVLKIIVFEPTLGGEEIPLPFRMVGRIASLKFTRKFLRWVVIQAEKQDSSFKSLNKKDQEARISEVYGWSLRAASELIQDFIKGVDPKDYKKIKVPVMIISAGLKLSFMSFEKTLERLKQIIPSVKVIHNPSFGHNFVREDPEKFSKLVLDFLEK